MTGIRADIPAVRERVSSLHEKIAWNGGRAT